MMIPLQIPNGFNHGFKVVRNGFRPSTVGLDGRNPLEPCDKSHCSLAFAGNSDHSRFLKWCLRNHGMVRFPWKYQQAVCFFFFSFFFLFFSRMWFLSGGAKWISSVHSRSGKEDEYAATNAAIRLPCGESQKLWSRWCQGRQMPQGRTTFTEVLRRLLNLSLMNNCKSTCRFFFTGSPVPRFQNGQASKKSKPFQGSNTLGGGGLRVLYFQGSSVNNTWGWGGGEGPAAPPGLRRRADRQAPNLLLPVVHQARHLLLRLKGTGSGEAMGPNPNRTPSVSQTGGSIQMSSPLAGKLIWLFQHQRLTCSKRIDRS